MCVYIYNINMHCHYCYHTLLLLSFLQVATEAWLKSPGTPESSSILFSPDPAVPSEASAFWGSFRMALRVYRD